MKILRSLQIRLWDQYTIAHEPIESIDLMERAAGKCAEWLDQNKFIGKPIHIFCGKGNNGGDGLAIARLMAAKNEIVLVYILESSQDGTVDFQTNLDRLRKISTVTITKLKEKNDFPAINKSDIIIDALFGSGLNRELEGLSAQVAEFINSTEASVISIDIPSGMFSDKSSKGCPIVRASHTLSFQCYKLAFLVAENAEFTGKVHVLEIGLDAAFLAEESSDTSYELIDHAIIQSIYKPRSEFAHKGKYGHALLIAGSYGKMGAAVLAAKACLRSGAGLLTCHIPKSGYEIMQRSVPEAMVMTDANESIITEIETDLSKYNAVGIGPGIGTEPGTKNMLIHLLDKFQRSMVIDADALNIISSETNLLNRLITTAILTPHPKEFARLFGESKNDFERISKAIVHAKENNLIIVLKGHNTLIVSPNGKAYFNSTGNAGMAKGGSGDVLTGVITGLLAHGYEPSQAAILGVYLHGLAGDFAAGEKSMEAMTASDIVEGIGNAFKAIENQTLTGNPDKKIS